MEKYYDEDEILEFNVLITNSRYYNEQTSYGVYGFSTTDDIPVYETSPDSDKDRKFSVLAGKVQELTVGGEYLVKAKHRVDKNYGDQYSPVAVYAVVPKSKESQMMFLKSIISERLAENLLAVYPNIVNDVVSGKVKTIDYNKVNGVREYTWNTIRERILNNYLISDIITMLIPYGVTYSMVRKLLDDEPNPSLLKKNLEENPYILTKVHGMGFKRIDELALKVKPHLIDSPERLVAFVKYFFTELGENEGHTWCSKEILVNEIRNNVIECIDKVEWLFENDDFLYIQGERVGLKYYHDIELEIFSIIDMKSKNKTSVNLTDKQIEKAIKEAEDEKGYEFVPEQLEAIRNTLKRPISIITGKAGTGKSSIMRAIIKAYRNNGYSVSASALSAMASQRITEATGFPAMTIHRTLGCQGFNKFLYNKDNPLLDHVVYMDEGSMVNARLFLHWLEAVNKNARIIISGDAKQLPPIGYGNVFSDLIELFADYNIVSELKKPMRQAEKSGVLLDANMIRDNVNPIKSTLEPKIVHGNMYYIFRANRQTLFNIAVKTYLHVIEDEGVENVVIAVPRKQGCLNCTNELNKYIQNELLKDETEYIAGYETTFKLGARVMQTTNDYNKNVFNGEIGYISEINEVVKKNKKEKVCVVTYPGQDGEDKKITYTKTELKYLDLAYAMTVHKLQGGSRKTVIGIVDNTHYQLLDNCMLYTLLTRTKQRCLLLAEPQAFLKCIRTSHNNRNTWLSIKQ